MNPFNIIESPAPNRFEGFTPEAMELYVDNLTNLAGALDDSGGVGLRLLSNYDELLLTLARNGIRLNPSYTRK
jgi:hypothetical protein